MSPFAPPLITVSGQLLQFCSVNNCGFIALRGERDEEHQFGVTLRNRMSRIPVAATAMITMAATFTGR
jgi:hypothetical protein